MVSHQITLVFFKKPGDNICQIYLDDIPIGVDLPKRGLSGLFGYSYTENIVNNIAEQHSAEDEKTYQATVWFNPEKKLNQRASLNNIKETTFLRLDTAKREVIDEVDKLIYQASVKNGDHQKGRMLIGIETHPHLIADALKSDNRFCHIQAVTYEVETYELGIAAIVTIIDRAIISKVFIDKSVTAEEISLKKF
jgi:proteasome lid subunit RPN8/RPN11